MPSYNFLIGRAVGYDFFRVFKFNQRVINVYLPEKPTLQGLSAIDGEKIALQSVRVEVDFNNLLCRTTMTQIYHNLEEKPIEAVYTFPLSGRAVLLNLKVVIGGRELQGVVVEKSSAEEQYEKAITEGNTAIMLEQVEPGLYTMNVGNILADETVSISMCYAELYRWQGDVLRFMLPTVIAPRYGRPEKTGLEPHQTPEYGLLVENRFQLRMVLSGILASAGIDCPSHQVAIARSAENTVVTLSAGEAFMDRDFVLNIRSGQAGRDAVLLGPDLDDGFVALASFSPSLAAQNVTPPRSVKIVVDCSGSMTGDSIAQARQAISDICDQLRPEDFFNLIAFGSEFKLFFTSQQQANKQNITTVRRLIRSLEADMGGTEIGAALQATIKIPGPTIPQDILLITDGEVWNGGEIIKKLKKSGHRLFTVGVGSAVASNFVLQLAQETGGACELVTPREEMVEKIMRQFRRIYLPRAEKTSVRWPLPPDKTVPCHIGPVFDGDTVHLFAFFRQRPSGQVNLTMNLADGRTFSQAVDFAAASEIPEKDNELQNTLARIAIREAFRPETAVSEVTMPEAIALTIKYQLISPWTNYLVVAVRSDEEKAEGLPSLRKVPQMLAAGWGGTGTVVREGGVSYSTADFCRRHDEEPRVMYSTAPSPEQEHRQRQQTSPPTFIYKCNRLHTKWFRPVLRIESFDGLLQCDLPDRIVDALKTIAGQHNPEPPEKLIVLAFLIALLRSPVGGEFNRNTIRAIKKAAKTLHPEEGLLNSMAAAFADISEDNWGPQYPYAEEDDGEAGDEE